MACVHFIVVLNENDIFKITHAFNVNKRLCML